MSEMPDINLRVLAPIGFVAIGSMAVLMGEVLLSRKKTVMGQAVTESWIGSVLAITAMLALALAFYTAWTMFLSGGSGVFNPDHAVLRLDRFSSFVSALLALSSLMACALSIAYLAELRINHGEYYALILLSTAGMMLMPSKQFARPPE